MVIKKRRAQNLTDYRKRVSLLKGEMPRLVVRKSNKQVQMQIVKYSIDGDIIVTSVTSNALRQMGWSPRSNTPTAYLTGMLLAKRASKIAGEECVLDIGLYKPIASSILFAAAKGAIDAGLKLRNNIKFDEKRLKGAHIRDYYIKAADKFSGYKKEKFDAQNIEKIFEKVKEQIMSK